MRPTLRFLGLVACLLLCMAVPAMAVGGVYDNAHMFSAGTISQLNSQIMAMRGSYNKDVYVITSPGGEGSWQSVAQRYTGGPNIDGVVIFIDQAAHKTYVAEDNRTKEVVSKDALESAINERFKQRDFDGGILAGTAYLQNTFASHSPGRGAVPPPAFAPRPAAQPVARSSGSSGFGLLFFFLILIVGIMIFVGIVRAIFRGVSSVAGSVMGGNVGPGYGPQYGPGYGPQYGPPAQGGGGFMSSFLGSAGGAVAGNALYDHFERRGGNEGYMPPVEPGGGGFVNAPSQPDWQQPGTSSDWSDTGSSSGGGADSGSFGGGDSGSSWGGGDSGSGGGGGSDWS